LNYTTRHDRLACDTTNNDVCHAQPARCVVLVSLPLPLPLVDGRTVHRYCALQFNVIF